MLAGGTVSLAMALRWVKLHRTKLFSRADVVVQRGKPILCVWRLAAAAPWELLGLLPLLCSPGSAMTIVDHLGKCISG